MILCFIGQIPTKGVPTGWWPHRVLDVVWTRRPMINVAMGCRTEPAIVHNAHVLQKLHFFSAFQFFFHNYMTYHKKKLHELTIFLYTNEIFTPSEVGGGGVIDGGWRGDKGAGVRCCCSRCCCSNQMGYQTSDFRLLWTITPNPPPPTPTPFLPPPSPCQTSPPPPPPCPPQYQTCPLSPHP